MYFQYSTSECKFFVALQLFLATEFRPKVSAEIRHFSPKVSVSAESQISTFGRTLGMGIFAGKGVYNSIAVKLKMKTMKKKSLIKLQKMKEMNLILT